MLSLKTFSLVVTAAVAMNGITALEQGDPANVPQSNLAPSDSPVQSQTLVPAWTTQTPTASNGGSYSYDSTGSSVAGSSEIDEGSDAKSNGAFTIPPSTDSGSEFNFKSPPPPPSSPGSLSTGSDLGVGSGSAPNDKEGLPTLSSSRSSPTGSPDLNENDHAIIGSSKSDGIQRSGDGSESQGSTSLPESSTSASAPCDEALSLAGSSATGSQVDSSSDTDQSVPGSESGSQPSGSTGPSEDSSSSPSNYPSQTLETGSQVEGSSDITQGSDANSPNQSDDSTAIESNGTPPSSNQSQTNGSKVAGSSGTEPKFPSKSTSCKRRLRQ
ncbi:hypothetical protein PInf_019093 [Phytophthora infestans]|nr:hypothetical protein PInf_019093 [Phytophthora infestans]